MGRRRRATSPEAKGGPPNNRTVIRQPDVYVARGPVPPDERARLGALRRETPLDVSFCAHAILQRGLFIVTDTLEDKRFARNPLAVTSRGFRSYAGALLESSDGLAWGTLVCPLLHLNRFIQSISGWKHTSSLEANAEV
jgi:hypothetical protein